MVAESNLNVMRKTVSEIEISDVNSVGRLDIQLLRSLLAISKSPTLSSAAALLNIPQPTMSLQMKRLEDRAGRPLFQPDRRGRPLRLSVHGERLVRHAERIIDAYEDAVRCLSTSELAGELRIGIPELIVETGISAVLSRFRSIYEDVRLQVVAADAEKLKDMVRDGELDARICINEEHSNDGQILWSEPFHWISSLDRSCLTASSLPLAFVTKSEPFRDHVIELLDRSSCNWTEAYTSDSMAKIYSAATSGTAIAAVPKSLIGNDVAIVDNHGALPKLKTIAFAIYRGDHADQHSDISPIIETMSDFIEDKMDKIITIGAH